MVDTMISFTHLNIYILKVDIIPSGRLDTFTRINTIKKVRNKVQAVFEIGHL